MTAVVASGVDCDQTKENSNMNDLFIPLPSEEGDP